MRPLVLLEPGKRDVSVCHIRHGLPSFTEGRGGFLAVLLQAGKLPTSKNRHLWAHSAVLSRKAVGWLHCTGSLWIHLYGGGYPSSETSCSASDPHFQPFTQVSVFGMRGLLMVIPAVAAPRGLFWALSVVLSEKEPRWLSDGLPAQCSLTQTSAFRVCLQPLAISEWFGNESLTDTSVSYLEWHVDSPLATWERRKKYGIIIWYHCHMISVFFNLPYFT